MKVLMVSKSQVVGAYHGKLRELVKLGVDLTVITPPRWGSQLLEIKEATSYKLHVLPCMLSGYNHFHFYRARINTTGADLVHLEEEPWSLVTYQVLRKAICSNTPTVFFTWQNILKNYPPPFSSIEQHTFSHAQAAIAGNEEAREILHAKGFSKPISVIPQVGVDPEIFKKRDVTRLRCKMNLDNRFVIGYVGRIVPEKGIADLIQALSLLPESCVLPLLGQGGFQKASERLAERLRVASRVHWMPQVSSMDVPDYMNLFDVLVLPSLTTHGWKEQFGRVLVEAMACETPPIGSSSGEIPNVIGDAGLIFPEGSAPELAAQLSRLHHNRDLQAQLAARGRVRVLRRFTHRIVAEATMDVYSKVLSGVGGTSTAQGFIKANSVAS